MEPTEAQVRAADAAALAAAAPAQGRMPKLGRRLTARGRLLPGILIAGVNRGGTTSLFHYLAQHPQVLPSVWKEVHFFDSERNWARGLDWYRAHFATRREARRLERRDGLPRVAMEGTPAYVYAPAAAERIARVLPEAKLVVVLRDPIERARSNWRQLDAAGRTRGSFAEEVEHELELLAGRPGRFAGAPPRLLPRGLYAEQLERLFRSVPRSRVFVGRSETMYADPPAFCSELFAWLGLAPLAVDGRKARNRTTPEGDLDSELRARLAAFYAPAERRLSELLSS